MSFPALDLENERKFLLELTQGGDQGNAIWAKNRAKDIGLGEDLTQPYKPAGPLKTVVDSAAPSTASAASAGGLGGMPPALPGNFTIQPRRRTSSMQTALDTLKSKTNRAPITSQEIMASPEYAAQAQVIDQQSGEAQAGLRRSLASRGMYRGTPGALDLVGTDARYVAAKNALIPRLLEAASARQQQDLQNQLSLINTEAGLENTEFTQGMSEFNATAPLKYTTPAQRSAQAVAEAGITGKYIPAEVRNLYQQVLAKKREAAANPALWQQYQAEADDLRNQIAAAGFPIDIVDTNTTLEQAAANVGSLQGIETQAAKTQRENAEAKKKADQRAQEQTALENAIKEVAAWGAVKTQKTADILGVPVGTPSYVAQNAAAERKAELDRARINEQGAMDRTMAAQKYRNPTEQAKDEAAQRYSQGKATPQDLALLGIATKESSSRDQLVREKAIQFAQKDSMWGMADEAERNQLIDYYMAQVAKMQPSESAGPTPILDTSIYYNDDKTNQAIAALDDYATSEEAYAALAQYGNNMANQGVDLVKLTAAIKQKWPGSMQPE